jgi:hypothetical protein
MTIHVRPHLEVMTSSKKHKYVYSVPKRLPKWMEFNCKEKNKIDMLKESSIVEPLRKVDGSCELFGER